MQISSAGLTLIEDFEGFRPTQYRDSVGVPTIGYGTTAADVNPLPKFLTRAQAAALLKRKVDSKYAPAVNSVGVPLNQNQFDALCSLAYNLGPGVMSTGFQIGRDLRARNYHAAADDFLHYIYAGGQRLQGLVNRREAERALFVKPVAPAPPAKPHGVARAELSYDLGTGRWHLEPVKGTVGAWDHADRWASTRVEFNVHDGHWRVG